MEIRISSAESIAAGCPDGVGAELRAFAPAGWRVARGSSAVEFVVQYQFDSASDNEVLRLFGRVSYRTFSLVECERTGLCRLVTLMRLGVGVSVVAEGLGHPRKAQKFIGQLVVE